MLIRLIVPGEHARVEDLNASLEAVLANHAIDRAIRDDVRLIVEELACNAIDHGGGNDAAGDTGVGQHPLDVHIDIVDSLLTLEFRDGGVAFDPTLAPTPDLDADILDRPIGGLGVHLIRELAESVEYRRADSQNILRVGLRIPSSEN